MFVVGLIPFLAGLIVLPFSKSIAEVPLAIGFSLLTIGVIVSALEYLLDKINKW